MNQPCFAISVFFFPFLLCSHTSVKNAGLAGAGGGGPAVVGVGLAVAVQEADRSRIRT